MKKKIFLAIIVLLLIYVTTVIYQRSRMDDHMVSYESSGNINRTLHYRLLCKKPFDVIMSHQYGELSVTQLAPNWFSHRTSELVKEATPRYAVKYNWWRHLYVYDVSIRVEEQQFVVQTTQGSTTWAIKIPKQDRVRTEIANFRNGSTNIAVPQPKHVIEYFAEPNLHEVLTIETHAPKDSK